MSSSASYARHKYAVIFQKSATGYAAYVPDLPGCITTGKTLTAAPATTAGSVAGRGADCRPPCSCRTVIGVPGSTALWIRDPGRVRRPQQFLLLEAQVRLDAHQRLLADAVELGALGQRDHLVADHGEIPGDEQLDRALDLEAVAAAQQRRVLDVVFARGQDDRRVVPNRPRKSVGSETTFMEDLAQQAEVERPVLDVVEDRPWVTIVWNDPINLMSYVTYVFMTYFRYDRPKAESLMLDVHHKGRAVVSNGTREKAEIDVFRLHEHGLWATMQQDD